VPRLQIIVGSTREGRHADAVLRWLLPAAAAHGGFDAEVLDLRARASQLPPGNFRLRAALNQPVPAMATTPKT
jgi:NAD(P)H-dependent FMN reductase